MVKTWVSAMAHPRYLKVGGRPVYDDFDIILLLLSLLAPANAATVVYQCAFYAAKLDVSS